MLKINKCGGGTINDNVIYGDISVVSSKGLSITNNHLENGAQIYINSSVVSLKENYIEKGKRPSILIRSGQNDNYDIYIQSVVNMTGDQFLYFNRNRGSENSETEQTGRHLKEARLNSISDTDILIDRSAILNLDNVYRYDMVVGFGSINPLGIKIDPFEENDFFRFNDYSYILSQKGSISRNEQLRGSVFYRNLNSTYLYAPMVSNWVEWYRPSGSYRYYYAIIWDRQRGIFRHNSSDQIYTLLTQTPIALTKYGKGMQFGTGVDSGKDAEGLIAGANYLIQLIRCRIDASGNPIMDSYEHVTIPLAGSRIIYDNGISVCGYNWEAGIVPGLDIDLGLPKYETYSFNSGHVEAAAYTRPQKPYSGWQKGDLITNIGDESDWTIEIIK